MKLIIYLVGFKFNIHLAKMGLFRKKTTLYIIAGSALVLHFGVYFVKPFLVTEKKFNNETITSTNIIYKKTD